MSKKQLHNRLDNLFEQFEDKDLPLPIVEPAAAINWTWEVNQNWEYSACGTEIINALGFSSSDVIGQPFFRFAIHPQHAASLRTLIDQGLFPVETELDLETKTGNWLHGRINIFKIPGDNGSSNGYRGFFQIVSSDIAISSLPEFPVPISQPRMKPQPFNTTPISSGVSYQDGKFKPASKMWTSTGTQTLIQNQLVAKNSDAKNPAVIAVPVNLREKSGVLEIIDDKKLGSWSEDERLLVQEVATQLSLALENAQLYAAVQQELGDRIHAEQETLQRNKDLANINKIGQELSKLTNAADIYPVVASTIEDVLNNDNLIIAIKEPGERGIKYPVYKENGKNYEKVPVERPESLIEGILNSDTVLFSNKDVLGTIEDLNLGLPTHIPRAFAGIPFSISDRAKGAILIQDFEKENGFTPAVLDLLSTIATQTSTSLENAFLFEDIRNAMSSLENRERYQANVAKAVAILTESGTPAMASVIEALAEASRATRISFARIQEDEHGLCWKLDSTWQTTEIAPYSIAPLPEHLPVSTLQFLNEQLREKIYTVVNINDLTGPEYDLFTGIGTKSILAIGVRGNLSTPSLLMFEEHKTKRKWQNEEISVLQVAADAISSTILREDLLIQVQGSLDETENLYNASHRLALANDFQEMVSSIAQGLRITSVNRGILVLFEHDSQNKVTRMRVAANWYSDAGSPPPPVGTEYMPTIYQRAFLTPNPIFIDDLKDPSGDRSLRDIFNQQRIGSMAILPLWAGKRQLGVLLLESEEKHPFTSSEIRSIPSLVDQMATSVENLRLFGQTQEALAETEHLYKITNGISQAQGPQDLARLVAENILPKNVDRVSLYSVLNSPDNEIADLECIGLVDVRGESTGIGERIPINSLPLMKALVGDSLILPDLAASEVDSVSKKTLQQLSMESVCFIPLRSTEKLIGLILLSARRPSDFDRDEIHLIQIVGNGITVALEKQRLLREAQRRALELQMAAELARDTSSTLELDALLLRFVNSLRERFSFYHVSLFLMDDKGAYANIRESTGEAGKELRARGHKFAAGSRSVVGNVAASGTPLVLNDVKSSTLYYPNPLLPETRSEMGIPLMIGKRIIGILDIQANIRNAFSQDDVTVLQILGDQIAIAIENARAFELSQKAVEEMKEVDRLKSQFLANMSHELRTPLNSIIGFSRVILKGIDGPINETQTQDLSSIYNSGQHLLRLITDILDLSKLEAGKMELQFSDINVSDMINSVLSTAVGFVKEKPVKLVQNLHANLPLVKADATRVRQVLLNLLSNAGKFTDEGTVTVEAEVTTEFNNRPEVLIKVIDTGPGIAEKDQSKLFQPFSQVDDSPTRKTGGTGLGLSISRSLIEMHGGRIGLLWSEVGRGSCFFFTLPLTVKDTQPLPTPPENSGNIILAIDDDRKVITLYERYLEEQGYQVIALTEPFKAVERARQIQPFAITVDIMMPGKDGWEVVHDLKNDPSTKHIPIIICSIMEDKDKGFSLGASDYLVKPFLQEEIINSLHRLNKDGKIHEILVIDDSAEDLRLTKKIIEENSKYTVRTVEGGKNGLEEVKSRCPDAIILDLFMPDLDGFAVLEALRSEKLYQNIPVIILTGADLTPDQHHMLSDFGNQMLSKSMLKEKDLLASLEDALKKIQIQPRRIQMHTKPLG